MTYRGNNYLKRSNFPIEWTPDRFSEYLKCEEDPIYFIENYMKIINADGELVPFVLYDYQKEIVLSYKDNRRTIVGTARQSGKSTTTCGFILWFILFHSNQTVAILANKADVAQEILGRVQFAYERIPEWLQQGITPGGWNKTSIDLENGSRVFSAATSKDAIRGFTINFLLLDEVAHVENWGEFYTASSQTMSNSKTAKLALVSTPNGMNHFYDFWQGAIEGNNGVKNGFNPIKVTWRQVPGRDEAWKQQSLADLNFDEAKFAQEHEMEFLGSSGTLISGWKLQQMKKQEPIYVDDIGNLVVYEKPIEGHVYTVIADVSRGKGLDYSAAHVIDITKMPFNQVCIYRNNKITPMDYAETLYHICKTYNEAHILVEINDVGSQICDILYHDFEYEGTLWSENAGRAGKTISFGGKGAELGVRTTSVVRNRGCYNVKLLIEQGKLQINDWETILELRTFSKKGTKYIAEAGKNDDLVMGLVLFGWLSEQDYFKEMNNIETLHALRDKSEQQMFDELAPIGFFNDGNQSKEEVIDGVLWSEYPEFNFPQ